MALIDTARDGLIGTIVLDHAAKRNAVSTELIGEICAALAMFRAENLRAVVIRARPGVKVWSAGFNIADKPLASVFSFFDTPPTAAGLTVLVLLTALMIRWPLAKAGDPNEPAPPTAIM